MFFKIGVLKILQYSRESTCVGVSFSLIKNRPQQVLYCEYWEIFENTFFIEHLWWLRLKGSIMKFLLESFQIEESCINN